jgi:hypothetical protein
MKLVRGTLITVTVIAAALGLAKQAQAAVYDWSYSDSENSGSGTLETTLETAGDTMVGITGSFNGLSITGPTAPGICCSSPPNDNLIFISAPYLDTAGIGFSTTDGTEWNLFYQKSSISFNVLNNNLNINGLSNVDAFTREGSGSFTLTAAPEASTWVMMVAGFASLGFAGYRARRAATGIA